MKRFRPIYICIIAAATILFAFYSFNGGEKTYSSSESINVYQKFSEEQPIRYLVIGDSIGRGSGAADESGKWFNVLERKMWKNHKSSWNGEYVVQSGATAFEGLYKFTKFKKDGQKDLVFIVFGENDRKYMDVENFESIYEALLRKVKKEYPQAELYTLTESSLKYDKFARAIAVVSQHYGAENIDLRPIFQNSGYTDKQLTKDFVHPNSLGYHFYAEAIYQRFLKKASEPASVAAIPSLLHPEANIELKAFFNETQNEGFQIRGRYLASAAKNSFLEYSFTGTAVGVQLLRFPEGGMMDVYIDGRFVTTISTWWPFARERYLYIANGLPDRSHKIRFVLSDGKSPFSKSRQTSIRISGIVAEDR
ncbi:SGNH/GDSL hydrolase family protein [Bacillus massiliglaciei]|uniref:SGNH/GDSL hydrolase family protein n=1 Tax=Bacillus massiliglaciei TaxID=1816693 RepID=UPI000DA5F88E|nr:SGNH/GDSL hydrolase family protein [Bacillus massiliglaciei]